MALLKRRKKAGLVNSSVVTNFQVVEAYKTIRTNLQFAVSMYERKIVAATSSEPSAGKSTTIANLAVALAQAKYRVLLIDADMRKPTQHKIFKIPNMTGLSDILGGFAKVEDAIHISVKTDLDVITAGTISPNPSELLGSPAMTAFMEKMGDQYDYILLDAPPVGVVADALTLIPHVTGLIMVARQKHTTYEELERAIGAVKQNGGNVLGVVITNVDQKRLRGSYYRRQGRYSYRSEVYGSTPSGNKPLDSSATPK